MAVMTTQQKARKFISDHEKDQNNRIVTKERKKRQLDQATTTIKTNKKKGKEGDFITLINFFNGRFPPPPS